MLPSVHISVTSGLGSPCAACAAYCTDDPAGDKVLCWILRGTKCTFSFVLSQIVFFLIIIIFNIYDLAVFSLVLLGGLELVQQALKHRVNNFTSELMLPTDVQVILHPFWP